MDAISLGYESHCSTVSNPDRLLNKLHLHAQWVYDQNWNVKYWEYLTRFNDIAGKVVADCFEVLERDENSFKWYSKVITKVIEKILDDKQHNPLSINTLPNDILDNQFIDRSLELLEIAPEDQSIILEIVEKPFGSNEKIQLIWNKLLFLQNKWIRIAIDDIHFTHHSIPDEPSHWKENLESLLKQWLLPDIIKIDGKKMNILFENKDNPDFKELIQTYKSWLDNISQQIIASWTECIIVAEWVNTPEEIAFATSLWCNAFQWFELKELFNK